jgi:hypothetical protein
VEVEGTSFAPAVGYSWVINSRSLSRTDNEHGMAEERTEAPVESTAGKCITVKQTI